MAPTAIRETEKVASPALLFDRDSIESNLDRMIEMVGGDLSRLRPHVKTHKCAEILALHLERGLSRVKCATIAEAELSARSGFPDVLLSYPAIGPTVGRLARLSAHFPRTTFSTLVDSSTGLDALEEEAPQELGVFLDLDIGMARTGITPGGAAIELIERVLESDHLQWRGIHAYDGHIHDADRGAREVSFRIAIGILHSFLETLDDLGIEVPSIVSGGSPTFAFHADVAARSPRNWECSPGTTVLWDAGYGEHYPDLNFRCAAFLLCRVVSHPGEDRACLDLGHKAVSAENPIANRVRFPDLPPHSILSQSEEHLVLRFAPGERPPIGQAILALPYHVCPTVALHERAHLVVDGEVTGETWAIAARDRSIGC